MEERENKTHPEGPHRNRAFHHSIRNLRPRVHASFTNFLRFSALTKQKRASHRPARSLLSPEAGSATVAVLHFVLGVDDIVVARR